MFKKSIGFYSEIEVAIQSDTELFCRIHAKSCTSFRQDRS